LNQQQQAAGTGTGGKTGKKGSKKLSDGRKGYGTTSFMLFAKMKRKEILDINPRTR
jgi:hypothetical protein